MCGVREHTTQTAAAEPEKSDKKRYFVDLKSAKECYILSAGPKSIHPPFFDSDRTKMDIETIHVTDGDDSSVQFQKFVEAGLPVCYIAC